MGKMDFTHETFSFAEEFCGLNFGDVRLNKRFVSVIENISQRPHAVVKRTQQSWADMMGAYRLLGNKRVTVDEILRAHREQTLARMSTQDRVLVIQDTSVLSYPDLRETKGLGSIAMGAFGKSGQGILVHTSLAVTTAGTPLGLLDQVMWSRGLGGPSERERWQKSVLRSADGGFTQVVCVADREADGIDFYTIARRESLDFVVRGKAGLRKCELKDEVSVLDRLLEAPIAGEMTAEVMSQKLSQKGTKSRNRFKRKVRLQIRFVKVQLKSGRHGTQQAPSARERQVMAVLVDEVGAQKQFEPIRWLLFTSLPVTSLEQAKDVIDIYKVRWEIEIFHKLLKSACQVEKAQLEDVSRVKKMITTLSIVAWRLHVLTKLQREEPDTSCTEVLTKFEWEALYIAINKSRKLPQTPPTIKQATLWIAKLGGFIGRKGDGEPGALTLWNGWIRLVHYTEMYSTMATL